MPKHSNRWKDLTGMRFGKLTATKPIHHEFASKWKATA